LQKARGQTFSRGALPVLSPVEGRTKSLAEPSLAPGPREEERPCCVCRVSCVLQGTIRGCFVKNILVLALKGG